MTTDLKQHLVKLLFEDYKFSSFVDNLNDIGIEVNQLNINVHDIILDMIGFPPEEPSSIERTYLQNDNSYSREWLDNELFDLYSSLRELHMFPSGIGFKENHKLSPIQIKERDLKVKEQLSKHVDWLYIEFKKLRSS